MPKPAMSLAPAVWDDSAVPSDFDRLVQGMPSLLVGGGLLFGQTMIPGVDVWGKVTKTLLMTAGVAVSGFGVWRTLNMAKLLSARDPNKIPPPQSSDPIAQASDVEAWISNENHVYRSQYTNQSYPYKVRNASDRQLQFYVGVGAYYEDTDTPYFVTKPLDPRPMITLAPGDTAAGNVVVPPDPNSVPIIGLGYGNRWIYLHVYKNRDDALPIALSEGVLVAMRPFGMPP